MRELEASLFSPIINTKSLLFQSLAKLSAFYGIFFLLLKLIILLSLFHFFLISLLGDRLTRDSRQFDGSGKLRQLAYRMDWNCLFTTLTASITSIEYTIDGSLVLWHILLLSWHLLTVNKEFLVQLRRQGLL